MAAMDRKAQRFPLLTAVVFLTAGVLSFAWHRGVGESRTPGDLETQRDGGLDAQGPSSEGPSVQPQPVERAWDGAPESSESEPPRARTSSFALSGRVVDFDGTPLSGAPLWFERHGTIPRPILGPPTARAGPEGEFVVKVTRGLDNSARQLRSVWLNRRDAILDLGTMEFPPGGSLDGLELRFPPTTRVVVQARTVNGNPAPGLGLCLFPRSRSESGEGVSEPPSSLLKLDQRRWTDAQGRAEFGDLEPGEYALRAEDASMVVRPPETIVKLGEGSLQSVEVTVDDLGTVHGFATRGGLPLAGADLTLEGPSVVKTTTDPDGSFRFPPVLPGKYLLRRGDWTATRVISQWATMISQPLEIDSKYATLLHPSPGAVEAAKRQERWIVVRSGANPVSLAYEEEPESAPFVVRIVDRSTGRPVAGARCRLFAAAHLSHETFPSNAMERPYRHRFGYAPRASSLTNKIATSDGHGLVKWGWLPEDRYVLTVRTRDHHRAREEVEIRSGARQEPLEIQLDLGASIHGIVLGAGGEPERNAWVAVLPGAMDEPFLPRANIFHFAEDPPSARTDAEGKFHLSGLEPGSVQFVVWSGTRSPVVHEASAPADRIVCRLSAPYGRLRIRTHRSGAAVRAAIVDVDYADAVLSIPASVLDLDVFFQTVGAWIRQPKYSESGEILEFERVLPSEALTVRVREGNSTDVASALSKRVRVLPGETVELDVNLDVKEGR